MTTVELIYDRDCPNVRQAHANLVEALAASGSEVRWTEWDRSAPESPPHVRGYGSPTVLVDGKDVAGATAGEARASCRLYGSEFKGAPSVEQIAAALRGSGRSRGWKSSAAAVPGIAFSFLPKLICPACWPAYAGLLSLLGLGFLLKRDYLLPLTAGFLMIAVGALGFRARARWGYGPFVLGLAASVLVLAGKFGIDSNPAMYGGIAALVAASVWNAWPARSSVACPARKPDSSSGISPSLRKEV
jgi:mercuric ion transport protein